MTTLRRNLKNTVNNYTDIQCKVREATCNEPWGPATTVMTEIADATYSVVEFAEIMMIIWKRLNDHGKNWRHVYKALLVLDYIIKRGSERVAQQCKEQIYSLLTLQDFRFIDKDGKDQGASVREKARQLVTLLKDDERLKSERKKALQAKERFAQNSTGIGSVSSKQPKTTGTLSSLMGRGESSRADPRAAGPANSTPGDARISAAIEQARPSDRDEENLQLELALAISKEEADKSKEEDDMLKATLERSKTETRITGQKVPAAPEPPKQTLLSLSQRPPPPPPSQPLDPWGMPMDASSAAAGAVPDNDPWAPSGSNNRTLLDATPTFSQPSNYAIISTPAQPFNSSPQPFSTSPAPFSTSPAPPLPPLVAQSGPVADPWGGPPANANILQPGPPINSNSSILQPMQTNAFSTPPASNSGNMLSGLGDFDPFAAPLVPGKTSSGMSSTTPPQMPAHMPAIQPSSKMGNILDNRTKHLVNIENLISTQTPSSSGATNPFGNPAPGSVFSGESTNPFLAANANNTQPALSLNELRNPAENTNPFC